jgi:polysaccharide deacetylase family protein (PEP-CTERM system associated)
MPTNTDVSILTVDVEEWYHLNFSSVRLNEVSTLDARVENNMEKLLALFEEFDVQATFFFLGSIAEKYPNLVRKTQSLGHEIASHGYGHQLVYRQTREEFYQDVMKSVEILESITGLKILGYRAPSWSISDDTPWAYNVLIELGFQYDASLFPFSTFLYGNANAPTKPFKIQANGERLYEIPASVASFMKFRIPFAGGFYLRVFPTWFISFAARLARKQGVPIVYYVHPREIDPQQPRLKLSPLDSILTYAGLKSTLRKLKWILSTTKTISMKQFIMQNFEL